VLGDEATSVRSSCAAGASGLAERVALRWPHHLTGGRHAALSFAQSARRVAWRNAVDRTTSTRATNVPRRPTNALSVGCARFCLALQSAIALTACGGLIASRVDDGGNVLPTNDGGRDVGANAGGGQPDSGGDVGDGTCAEPTNSTCVWCLDVWRCPFGMSAVNCPSNVATGSPCDFASTSHGLCFSCIGGSGHPWACLPAGWMGDGTSYPCSR